MRKSAFVFLALLSVFLALPLVANAQTYHRPYYEQRPLAKVQMLPYFLENRTGSPLHVTLLVKFPNGVKELWSFDIAPNSEVYANLPLGGVRASVESATASVPRGNKIVPEKVKSYVDDRDEKDGRVLRGWYFYRN